MKRGIETTMDGAGRVVLPKAIREEAGLRAGMPLRLSVVDGGVEIKPAPRRVRVERRGRLAVAVPDEEGEPLTGQVVRRTQARLRGRLSR